MVNVRLAQGWTDSAGTDYPAGATVEVDAATLAGLEARGVVAEAAPSSRPGGDDDTDGIPEPSDDDPDGIPEPSRRGGRSGGGTDGIPEPS